MANSFYLFDPAKVGADGDPSEAVIYKGDVDFFVQTKPYDPIALVGYRIPHQAHANGIVVAVTQMDSGGLRGLAEFLVVRADALDGLQADSPFRFKA